MPFEIFGSSADDVNDELLAEEANWPEELSLLGAQLSADAARLASLYPSNQRANHGSEQTPETTSRTTRDHVGRALRSFALRGRWIAAAAILALASLATYYASSSFEPGALAEHDRLPAVQVAANADANAGLPQDAVLFEETGFENLSLPAQEALLDLFEDDQLAQASLSI